MTGRGAWPWWRARSPTSLPARNRAGPDLARRDLVTKAVKEDIWGEKGDLFTQEDLDRIVAYLADALVDRILERR